MCERCTKFNVDVSDNILLRRTDWYPGFLHGQRSRVDYKWRTGWKFDEQLIETHRGEWDVMLIRCFDVRTVYACDAQTFYQHCELIPNTVRTNEREFYLYEKFFVTEDYPAELNPNTFEKMEWLRQFKRHVRIIEHIREITQGLTQDPSPTLLTTPTTMLAMAF